MADRVRPLRSLKLPGKETSDSRVTHAVTFLCRASLYALKSSQLHMPNLTCETAELDKMNETYHPTKILKQQFQTLSRYVCSVLSNRQVLYTFVIWQDQGLNIFQCASKCHVLQFVLWHVQPCMCHVSSSCRNLITVSRGSLSVLTCRPWEIAPKAPCKQEQMPCHNDTKKSIQEMYFAF